MRVELGGKGYPRSEFALEGAGVDTSGDAPIVLLLENGEVFTAADYISLGYTNFEVWCVGAAGGRGGLGSADVDFSIAHAQVAMPSDVWDSFTGWHRENLNQLSLGYYGYLGGTGYNPDDVFSGAPLPPPISIEEHLDYYYPGHVVEVQTFRDSFLKLERLVGSSGGGGGGLHIVSGALSDLDAEVSATVGAVGADGAIGQTLQGGAWYPPPPYKTVLDAYIASISDKTAPMVADRAYIRSWQNAFDGDGLPSFLPPGVGGDGGYSSFGDICQASGGKGGTPSIPGAGGVGNSLIAGGGAAAGKDGTWDRESIGQGGGGGLPGKPGGKGSFSYGDTSIYGIPGLPGYFTESRRRFDYVTGDLLETLPTGSSFILPGGGGSVKLPGNRKYGSKASGYSPNGAVLIRLIKTD